MGSRVTMSLTIHKDVSYDIFIILFYFILVFGEIAKLFYKLKLQNKYRLVWQI